MGQQNSRHNCTCGCGAWERRPPSETSEAPSPQPQPKTSNIQRYVSAVTERQRASECVCRVARGRPVVSEDNSRACVCTSYRPVDEEKSRVEQPPALPQHCTVCSTDQLAAVLSLGARDLRREPYALVGVPQRPASVADAQQDSRSLSIGDEAGEGEGEGSSGGPGGEVLVWSLHSYPRLPLEGEERARSSRGMENAHGSDGQNNLRPHLQVVCKGELRALLLRATSPAAPIARVHTQVDYIHCLVPDLREITAFSFYWGKMDRYEADRLLENKPEGTFLLRDSAQEEHLFSVSFRKYGRSLHARIEHLNHKFSFDSHDPAVYCADTITKLIHHYKDPACVMFFEPMLTAPLPRTNPFSLQQLARAVIVSSTTYDGVESLPLPPRLRAYLKVYHYRQRVCVRRLDGPSSAFNRIVYT